MNNHPKEMEPSTELNRTPLSAAVRYALFGVTFGVLLPVAGTIFRIVINHLPITFANMLHIQATDPLLWIVDTTPIVLGSIAAYAGNKQDQLSKTNAELQVREYELKTYQAGLEQYVNERTAELVIVNQRNERRSAQFEAIARISRTISSTKTLDPLLDQITETISAEFNFYHVGIFILDARKENAILVAANSQGGKRMLERGHRLSVGEHSIVGYSIFTSQPRIALDVGKDAVFFNNPDLPNTHSEISLPLQVGNEIIGVLDVQSTETNAFSQEDVYILSTLADQVGIAIQNARSYQQTQEALLQAQKATAQMTGSTWSQFTKEHSGEVYFFDGIDAEKTDKTTTSGNNSNTLTIPITLRGARIGTLRINSQDPERAWTEDDITLAEAAAERTALAMENARLLQDAQKRAAKERIIGEISTKISALVNIDDLLKTTAQELSRTVSGAEVAIQIENTAGELQ